MNKKKGLHTHAHILRKINNIKKKVLIEENSLWSTTPITQETEAGGLLIQSLPGIQGKFKVWIT